MTYLHPHHLRCEIPFYWYETDIGTPSHSLIMDLSLACIFIPFISTSIYTTGLVFIADSFSFFMITDLSLAHILHSFFLAFFHFRLDILVTFFDCIPWYDTDTRLI
ncbi:hypothetical protein EDB19DRAFT_1659638 [Suillus lakei]|nr:hypothetical protein EDB19DRAFT_1659638 [Suillus lakei]